MGLRVLKLALSSSFGWAVWVAVADGRPYILDPLWTIASTTFEIAHVVTRGNSSGRCQLATPPAERPEDPKQVHRDQACGDHRKKRAQGRVERKSDAQAEVEHDDRQHEQQGVYGDPGYRAYHRTPILPRHLGV